jgi:2'-5' RNA ligase
MGSLKYHLDGSLQKFGYEPENRAFAPHLTLGRIKGMRQVNQLSQLITQYKDTEFQTLTIDKFVLFESRLLPDGPDYVVIHSFGLNRLSS